MNRWFFIIVGVLALLYVTHIVRRNKLPIKESFWWFMAAIAMLLLAIFPQVIDWVAQLLGIAYPPTLLLTMCVIFLLFIIFKDGRRIAKLQTQSIELEQQVALIKNQLQQSDQKKQNAQPQK